MIRQLFAVMGMLSLAHGAAQAPQEDPAHPPIGVQPGRPIHFAHVQPASAPEELMRTDTPRLEKYAAGVWATLRRSFAAGPYQPDWISLAKHPCPEWFQDAKLGLFIDWGPWSVAGYAPIGSTATYPDWYEKNLSGDLRLYHEKTWGKDVAADDLLDMMSGDGFDADKFVALAQSGGMKYVVPFLKHHGGYCLWDSAVTHRNSAEMGIKRDIAQEISRACRRKGLKFGAYVSLGEWAYPIIDNGKVRKLGFNDRVAGDLAPEDPFIAGKIPVHDYSRDYLAPQIVDLVEKTNPDILWYDGEWEAPAETWKTPEINAWFYNRAVQRRQQVCINDRSGSETRSAPGKSDFMTSEFHSINPAAGVIWEENRGLGHSYGYNWQEALDDKYVMSDRELVAMVADIVGRGGNLLLMLNPDGSGRVPPNQERRIRALGGWLRTHGEAIYATRSLGLTVQPSWGRMTRSKSGDRIYLIVTNMPESRRLDVPLSVAKLGKARLLGGGAVAASPSQTGFSVQIPSSIALDPLADVITVDIRGLAGAVK